MSTHSLSAETTNVPEPSECQNFISRQVGQTHPMALPEICPILVLNHASASQTVKGNFGDRYYEVYGYNKMVVFQRSGISSPDDEHAIEGQISGDQTLFGEASEIALSQNGSLLYVLSRPEGGIYTFELKHGGNIAPVRFFQHPVLKNALNLTWDEKRNLLIVDSMITGEQIHLNPLADHRGRLNIHHKIILDDLP